MELAERVAKALSAAKTLLAPPLSAPHGCDGDVAKAVWSTAYINSLNDSAFLYVEPGGKKDADGKTVPRTLRHFPVRDADGNLDLPHLRNALARIPQSALPDAVKDRVRAKAERLLASVKKVVDEIMVEKVDGSADVSLQTAASLSPSKLSFRKVTAERLRELTDVDLHNFDADAHTVFRNHFVDAAATSIGELTKEDLVASHAAIVVELRRRGLPHVRQALPAGVTEDDALDDLTAPLLVEGAAAAGPAVGPTLATARALISALQNDLPYALIWQRWERPVIVRGASTQDAFHLLLKRADDLVEDFQFQQDPLSGEKIVVVRRELAGVQADALMAFQGVAAPGAEVAGVVLNPTRSTPSTLTILSRGRVALAVDEPVFKQAQIRSGSLADGLPAGQFTLTADAVDPTIWYFEGGGRSARVATATPADPKIQKLSLRPWTEEVHFLKADDQEEHFVLGVVLEPDVIDAQNDTYTAEEVRKAAHFFMENYAHIGLMHKELIDGRVKILESYVAPTDFKLGDQVIKAGTWLLGARILDPQLWADIKAGKITGWSIGGSAIREPTDVRAVANACFGWAA